MASAYETILASGTAPAPESYEVPSTQEIVPLACNAIFDGTAASGAFVPTLEIISDAGVVIARMPCSSTVAQGSSAEVTFAPFLRGGSTGGVVPPPAPIAGYDAYAVYTAGASGNFVIPTAAKILIAVCIGGGGGGGGGGNMGTTNTNTAGGGGGGGGACAIGQYDCAMLEAMYPSGVPFTVGGGGGGGNGANSGSSGTAGVTGSAGTATSFGGLTAGGGGAGTGGGPSGVTTGGGGGGHGSAITQAGGIPNIGTGLTGVGIQGPAGNSQSSPMAAAEYGGGAGGSGTQGGLGYNAGTSLFGGGGGAGGGGYNFGAGQPRVGGKGGVSNVYSQVSTQGSGTNAPGVYTGPYAGGGGDGGDGKSGVTKGLIGQDGAIGGGGGGGGASASGGGGKAGTGGGGLLLIYLLA